MIKIEPCASNRDKLQEVLNTVFVEQIDDDITITYGNNSFGAPFKVTAERLIKRQNDIVSGNIPYTQTVSRLILLFIFVVSFTL